MSSLYIPRLRAIRDEYEATRQGIAYVNTHWNRHSIYRETEMKELTSKNFQCAARYLYAAEPESRPANQQNLESGKVLC